MIMLFLYRGQISFVQKKIFTLWFKISWSHRKIYNMLIFFSFELRVWISHHSITWMLSQFKLILFLESLKIIWLIKSLVVKVLFIHYNVFYLRSKKKKISISIMFIKSELFWASHIDVSRSVPSNLCTLFAKICGWLGLSKKRFYLVSLRSLKASWLFNWFDMLLFFFETSFFDCL